AGDGGAISAAVAVDWRPWLGSAGALAGYFWRAAHGADGFDWHLDRLCHLVLGAAAITDCSHLAPPERARAAPAAQSHSADWRGGSVCFGRHHRDTDFADGAGQRAVQRIGGSCCALMQALQDEQRLPREPLFLGN